MKSTEFRTIKADPTGKIVFRNPFPDRYEGLMTGAELVRAWKEESRIREAELFVLRNIIED